MYGGGGTGEKKKKKKGKKDHDISDKIPPSTPTVDVSVNTEYSTVVHITLTHANFMFKVSRLLV